MNLRFSLPLALAASLLSCATFAQEILTPTEHLGRPVGADFHLADWNEVSEYFLHLGERSPRAIVRTVGTTTEGRDFLLATISSEENLARLDEIRAAAKRLADPRGMDEEERDRVLAKAKPILFVSIGMHSTETAAPQMGMELAHRLATSDEEPYASARDELVVLIAPCLNPDGLDHVVSWYRETVGGPYEAAGMLELYQHYSGHDNNRDWFMLSQAETRIVSRLLYAEWFPQVYWDVHQHGASRERFFVPPFRDPLNPNLDPGIITAIDQLGTRALFDLTREGFQGVATGVSYDMWWIGGNRTVPVRHNIVGLLTEAASVKLATPVFLPRTELSGPRGIGDYAPSNRFPDPWPGGWWRLRDIIDYEHAFGRSLLASLAREPGLWLENALAAAERSIAKGREDAPRAWVIPGDNRDRGAVRRLVDSLLVTGLEVHVADAAFRADGRGWPAGSVVIRRDQPYGQYVKDLFEVQEYPDGQPPYDVAGWTLPLLLGVRCVEVMGELEPPLRPVADARQAVAGFIERVAPPQADMRDSDAWAAAFDRLGRGESVAFGLARRKNGGRIHLSPPWTEEENPGPWTVREAMPRIGIYAPWSGVMNEGWLRWVFDTFGVPYVTVRNEMIRAGELDAFLDVLVLPSISGGQIDEGRAPGSVPPRFAGGLGPTGGAAIDDFVRGGGTLITLGRSSSWAIELFGLPLRDTVREAEEFSCPGSVVRAVPEPSELTAGLPESFAVLFSRSTAWEVIEPEDGEDAEADDRTIDVLLRYAPTRTLLSGWIVNPEAIAGRAAWVRASHGAGAVHLFGFRPQYRSWAQASFHLLFRALLLDR